MQQIKKTAENERIEKWKERKAKEDLIFAYKKTDEGIVPEAFRKVTPTEKYELVNSTVSTATGSVSEEFSTMLMQKTVRAFMNSDDVGRSVKIINAVTGVLLSLKPADEIEAMLITRLLYLDNQASTLMSMADKAERIDHAERYINMAVKLMRLHNETTEALTRYRRKGEQRVIVQHQEVNVGNGGQAVVHQGEANPLKRKE